MYIGYQVFICPRSIQKGDVEKTALLAAAIDLEGNNITHVNFTDNRYVGWLLEIYVLATSKVISGEISIHHSEHLWWLYSAAHQTGWPNE